MTRKVLCQGISQFVKRSIVLQRKEEYRADIVLFWVLLLRLFFELREFSRLRLWRYIIIYAHLER